MQVFLSGDSLRGLGRQVIFPPDGLGAKYVEDRFSKVFYELCLGDEVYISTNEIPTRLRDRQVINIAPGEFAILTTAERVEIPKSILGILSMKFSWTKYGLVNVSGFHVDPGFCGKLHFAVYHAGSNAVTLRRLDPIFMLFLAKIDTPQEYKGAHQGQDVVPAETMTALKGPPISLKHLNDKVEKLQAAVGILTGLTAALIAALIAVLLRGPSGRFF